MEMAGNSEGPGRLDVFSTIVDEQSIAGTYREAAECDLKDRRIGLSVTDLAGQDQLVEEVEERGLGYPGSTSKARCC